MIFIKPAYANCPVCIVTIGGGFIIAKKLGIDDLLVSIWISGLNTALAFWFASLSLIKPRWNQDKKKVLNNPILWSLFFYATTLIYLWYTKQIGHPKNVFMGIDKVFLGMTIGLIVFLLSMLADRSIRIKNGHEALFNYQKVIVPILFLLITTIIFKLLL